MVKSDVTYFELNRLNYNTFVLYRCHKCDKYFTLGNLVVSIENPNEKRGKRILFHKSCYRFMVRLGSVGLK